MSSYEFLWVHLGSCGFLGGSIGSCWFSTFSIELLVVGFLRASMGSCVSMSSYASQWFPIGSCSHRKTKLEKTHAWFSDGKAECAMMLWCDHRDTGTMRKSLVIATGKWGRRGNCNSKEKGKTGKARKKGKRENQENAETKTTRNNTMRKTFCMWTTPGNTMRKSSGT